MVTLGIHGLGRVGRSLLRRCMLEPGIRVVAINELDPDPEHIAYGLNYDTVYGPAPLRFVAVDSCLSAGDLKIRLSSVREVDAVPWSELGVDCLVDASGGIENAARLRRLVETQVISRAFMTRLDPAADYVLTLGSNEDVWIPSRHRVVSSNTCDATAIAPVIRALDEAIGLEDASLAILHPWLNHQNLLDARPAEGACRSYELGRASCDNIIPKGTSAEAAIRAVYPGFDGRSLSAISYRIPTSIVACADLGLRFRRATSREELLRALREYQERSRWKLVDVSSESLVSSDFKGNAYSAIVEERLVAVSGGRQGRLALWYDNESGYAARVLDQIRMSFDR